ncbi:gliding motility protein GldL [Lutibacter sp. B1]|uniref:gliding motility protein GldL n=1 Tax=Lutibacter sp. B1 TaxID=2725996 RepID=UPI001456AA15|nr:gliding motility protein GldL [Lutibacter sp. B1]NLP56946.1 gliding motility protein GldL [Lutibacter sp. B1]
MITKKIISFFTFGIFLLLIGGISKLFNWSQSNLIMAIGLVFELLAALLFIWGKLKNN